MAQILRNEPLWNKTTFRIGGPAQTLVYPETQAELAHWLASGEVSFILGGGANLLVADEGIGGVTIGLTKGLCGWSLERRGGKVIVAAQAGIGLTKLAGLLMKEAVAGLEFAYGIPGSLGGALVMNAGAKGREMKDVVESVTVMEAEGRERTLARDEIGFSYRASSFPEGVVIAGATLSLSAGGAEEINERMRNYQVERKRSQPLDRPSAGSVFKNPPGDFAGRLIEAAGLKGESVGGARVSEKHANFIVNMGGATAKDTLALIRKVEREVYERFGVRLEREIKLVGDFDG